MANFSNDAIKILEARYLKKDKIGKVIETPDGMLSRVAKHVSNAEKADEDKKLWCSKFMSIMDTLEFLPNSPTLMNSGRELGQLSACFVLPVADDLANIFEMVKQVALIHKSGGGTGIILSHLRPFNSMVQSTSGVASGPTSFMRVFDVATDVVKQGGARRGANMGILVINHPDIYEFIKCKEDTSKFQNFNISVAITDNFLKAAQDGNSFPLRNPYTKEKQYIKAKELFDLICHEAWLTGEPGLVFIDTINKKNPIPELGFIEGTNPCITGDTLIAVADGRGPVSIRELTKNGKDVPVYCKDKDGWTHIRFGRNPRLTKKEVKIVKVSLDDGSFLRVTENHKFLLRNGNAIEAKYLVNGQSLMRFDRFQFKYKEQGLPYWAIQRARGNVFQEHRLITEFEIGRRLLEDERVHHKNHNGLDNLIGNRELTTLLKHSQIHDISGDKNPMRRFPEKNPWRNPDFNKRHCGHPLSEERKEKIKVGVRKAFADGSVGEKISKRNKELWQDPIYREKTLAAMNHKVISVVFDGYEDVYNITVDEFHNYCVVTSNVETHQSGIAIENCGEQPLLPYESCNLGSIDVSKLVKDKKVDWDRLDEMVSIAVRFLDDIIDINNYPNIRIARKTKLTRKIGLGVMGWADMLINLGIRYDNDKALKLAERLMMNIREIAHITSREIGQEKGFCFKLKRRNVCLTTIAPTGTLSLLAGCSSGIEPVFGKQFTKTVLGNVKLDLGKKYEDVDSNLLVTAYDIPVEMHVRMQAAFQRYVDNAVSKTINLLSSATEGDIKKAFLLAHELECKGVTVYREGSRAAPIEITVEGELSECANNRCII